MGRVAAVAAAALLCCAGAATGRYTGAAPDGCLEIADDDLCVTGDFGGMNAGEGVVAAFEPRIYEKVQGSWCLQPITHRSFPDPFKAPGDLRASYESDSDFARLFPGVGNGMGTQFSNVTDAHQCCRIVEWVSRNVPPQAPEADPLQPEPAGVHAGGCMFWQVEGHSMFCGAVAPVWQDASPDQVNSVTHTVSSDGSRYRQDCSNRRNFVAYVRAERLKRTTTSPTTLPTPPPTTAPPTSRPTPVPTVAPTTAPTTLPSSPPTTMQPSASPTRMPTGSPSHPPTEAEFGGSATEGAADTRAEMVAGIAVGVAALLACAACCTHKGCITIVRKQKQTDTDTTGYGPVMGAHSGDAANRAYETIVFPLSDVESHRQLRTAPSSLPITHVFDLEKTSATEGFGFQVAGTVGGRIVIGDVISGSNADLKGLWQGDTLLEVNGQSVAEFPTPRTLLDTLMASDTITLGVHRGAATAWPAASPAASPGKRGYLDVASIPTATETAETQFTSSPFHGSNSGGALASHCINGPVYYEGGDGVDLSMADDNDQLNGADEWIAPDDHKDPRNSHMFGVHGSDNTLGLESHF